MSYQEQDPTLITDEEEVAEEEVEEETDEDEEIEWKPTPDVTSGGCF